MPPPPTFADILPVKPLSSHTYSADFRTEWCIGDVPNGGYVTSAFLVVARTHMQATHGSRSQPHPINLHLEFLRRTSATEALFTVKDIKLGARISNLHITLSQKQQPDGKQVDEVEGYITMSNLTTETGLSLDTSYALHPPPFPVDLPTLAATGDDMHYALRRHEPFPDFRRASQNVQLHLLHPTTRAAADRAPSIVDQWVRFYPHRALGRWTNDALGYLVDIFPQVVEQYVNPALEAAADSGRAVTADDLAAPRARHWYPTLVLNLDVKRALPPDGVDWLFSRVQAKAIANGRFDLDVEIFDAEGRLVAISTHASLVLDASRNLKTAPKGRKAESKM